MFITFEGIEGSGKSTLQALLSKKISELCIPVVTTCEPGDSSIGAAIRKILLDAEQTQLAPETELHLFLADRSQHMREVILPALASGKWVLCDRYHDSTLAYQMYGRGLNLPQSSFSLTETILPDVTFLIDLDVETGLARATTRNKLADKVDRFDNEATAFHSRVRDGFLKLASYAPDRFYILDGNKKPEELCEECLAILSNKFSLEAVSEAFQARDKL